MGGEVGDAVQRGQVQGDAPGKQQHPAGVHDERAAAGHHEGGGGHWCSHDRHTETICPMQEGGQNGADSTGPAGQRHPQQG